MSGDDGANVQERLATSDGNTSSDALQLVTVHTVGIRDSRQMCSGTALNVDHTCQEVASKGSFACPFCDKIFVYEGCLTNHVRKLHPAQVTDDGKTGPLRQQQQQQTVVEVVPEDVLLVVAAAAHSGV